MAAPQQPAPGRVVRVTPDTEYGAYCAELKRVALQLPDDVADRYYRNPLAFLGVMYDMRQRGDQFAAAGDLDWAIMNYGRVGAAGAFLQQRFPPQQWPKHADELGRLMRLAGVCLGLTEATFARLPDWLELQKLRAGQEAAKVQLDAFHQKEGELQGLRQGSSAPPSSPGSRSLPPADPPSPFPWRPDPASPPRHATPPRAVADAASLVTQPSYPVLWAESPARPAAPAPAPAPVAPPSPPPPPRVQWHPDVSPPPGAAAGAGGPME
eukprot:TRINITY_DN10260_c0_g1_i1.p1 TRINITY_DN10260_c0_g1~~TRINITY_DN10260_c0_g1_i1.p1  ORF type:complete len:267 (+),score=71.57 TRINITY_DN10260_c0_g1_i1:77-877(+)